MLFLFLLQSLCYSTDTEKETNPTPTPKNDNKKKNAKIVFLVVSLFLFGIVIGIIAYFYCCMRSRGSDLRLQMLNENEDINENLIA